MSSDVRGEGTLAGTDGNNNEVDDRASADGRKDGGSSDQGKVAGGAPDGSVPPPPAVEKAGGGEAAISSSFADSALGALNDSTRGAVIRSLARLDDDVLTHLLHVVGFRVGAFRYSHGAEPHGPHLTMDPEVEATRSAFNAVLDRDAIAPRTLGLHLGTKPGEKQAMVAKRRAKLHDALIRTVGQRAGEGLHTSISSMGANILRMLFNVPVMWTLPSARTTVTSLMKIRPQRFIDGIFAEQVPHVWSQTSSWRTHNRYPMEVLPTEGPWAQNASALMCWALSTVMGSRGNSGSPAVPVVYTAESADDSLLSIENGEVPEIVVDLEPTLVRVGSVAHYTMYLNTSRNEKRAQLREANAAYSLLPANEKGEQKSERVKEAAEQVKMVEKELDDLMNMRAAALRSNEVADAVAAVTEDIFEDYLVQTPEGAFRTTTDGMAVRVDAKAIDTLSDASEVQIKKSIRFRFSSLDLVMGVGDAGLSCPQLDIFLPEVRDLWAGNVWDGKTPKTMMLAERALRAFVSGVEVAAVVGEGGQQSHAVTYHPGERVCAEVWRHFTYQFRGLGAHMAALCTAASMLVPESETEQGTRLEGEIGDKDMLWSMSSAALGKRPPDDKNTKGALLSGTGLSPHRFHTARTEMRSHSLSPGVMFLAENNVFLRAEETVPTYEIASPGGIRRATSIIALAMSMDTDRLLASVSVSGDFFRFGSGIFGVPQLGQTCPRAIFDSGEREAVMSFNAKYSRAIGLTLDAHSRPPEETKWGSTVMEASLHTSGAGRSPERCPPYMYPTVFGRMSEYLPGTADAHTLHPSTLVDGDTLDYNFLRHGCPTSPADLDKPVFITAQGTSPEARANPPYQVWCTTGRRVSPSPAGYVSLHSSELDARILALPQLHGVRLHNRTIGTAVRMSMRSDSPFTIIIDTPMTQSTASLACIHRVCVPSVLKVAEAGHLSAPKTALVSAVSRIFR